MNERLSVLAKRLSALPSHIPDTDKRASYLLYILLYIYKNGTALYRAVRISVLSPGGLAATPLCRCGAVVISILMALKKPLYLAANLSAQLI